MGLLAQPGVSCWQPLGGWRSLCSPIGVICRVLCAAVCPTALCQGKGWPQALERISELTFQTHFSVVGMSQAKYSVL